MLWISKAGSDFFLAQSVYSHTLSLLCQVITQISFWADVMNTKEVDYLVYLLNLMFSSTRPFLVKEINLSMFHQRDVMHLSHFNDFTVELFIDSCHWFIAFDIALRAWGS